MSSAIVLFSCSEVSIRSMILYKSSTYDLAASDVKLGSRVSEACSVDGFFKLDGSQTLAGFVNGSWSLTEFSLWSLSD